MLGISEDHVVEHVEGHEDAPAYDADDAVTLVYNDTDPLTIEDGIDRVTVVEEADGQYLVDYWGYLAGYLRITREGAAELGSSLLGDRGAVPNWLVAESPDGDSLPWWVSRRLRRDADGRLPPLRAAGGRRSGPDAGRSGCVGGVLPLSGLLGARPRGVGARLRPRLEFVGSGTRSSEQWSSGQ